ncbi:MAG: hypothetical protein ACK5V5_06350 [Cyclobacteriaceae bacterium]|nr:hypothetical protein [Flammeovirgaceae bacterium]
MKRASLLMVSLLLLPFWLDAQSFYAIRRERSLILVAGTGTSSYLGELSKPGDYLDAKPNLNLGLQMYLSRRISIRSELTWFTLKGADGEDGPEGRNYSRNLSFKSSNVEFNAVGLIDLYPRGNRFYRRPSFNIYAFGGLGFAYFNPKAELNGEIYALQPLQTEGVSYSRITPVIPFGGGVRFRMGPNVNISVEGGLRMTFSDYLDDVSTVYKGVSNFADPIAAALSDRRPEIGKPNMAPGSKRGNSETNDAYWLLNFKLEYYLPVDLGIQNRQRSYKKSRKSSMYRYNRGGGLRR